MSTASTPIERFKILCIRCDRPMFARPEWIGWEVECPYCHSVVRVPEASDDGLPTRSTGPNLSPRKYFNFPCPRCESLLEGHTGMCGHSAVCPTCAARMIVPHVKRGGAPMDAELLDDDTVETAPLHAYAASGYSAPKIVQRGDESVIECPRCGAHNAIDANHCRACEAPFTMDGAQTMPKARSDSLGTTAVVCGVFGLLMAPIFIPGLLAVWFGLQSMLQSGQLGRARAGLIGLCMGVISLGAGSAYVWWMMKP